MIWFHDLDYGDDLVSRFDFIDMDDLVSNNDQYYFIYSKILLPA